MDMQMKPQALNSKTKASFAYHEAGHAVIARVLGYEVVSVHLDLARIRFGRRG
jgi:ATP-dependent Zn protease